MFLSYVFTNYFVISESYFNETWWLLISNDIFSTCCVCATVEQLLKVTFKRKRPTYRKQSKKWSVLFENYSFPSGHTLRVAYFAYYFVSSRVLLKSPYSSLFFDFTGLPLVRTYIYVLPFVVGISRVLVGKHYLLDVVAGGSIGLLLCKLIETTVTVESFRFFKLCCRLNIAIQFFFIVLLPTFKRQNYGRFYNRAFEVIYYIHLFLICYDYFSNQLL